MSILSAAILLAMVMDPLGNIPLFATALKDIEGRKRHWIVLREHLIALGVLVAFLLGGRYILDIFQIEKHALSMAGGIIIFLIALKMVFAEPENVFGTVSGGEPFIVPLAVPLIAGPSAMTTVLLLATRYPTRLLDWLVALICAWLASLLLLLLASTLSRLLGDRTLVAFQRLMGLLLTAVAVQMFMAGIKLFVEQK